jgi:hypothetical protein
MNSYQAVVDLQPAGGSLIQKHVVLQVSKPFKTNWKTHFTSFNLWTAKTI